MNRFAALALAGLLATLSAQGAVAATKKPAPAKPAPAPVDVPLPAADAEQTAAAEMALKGDYACEFKQTVTVTPDAKNAGYIDVGFGKRHWTMKPVLSSTGALRLEDVKGQTLMLQIAHKSMIMDVKVGQRLVDDCMHEKQVEAKKAYEAQQASGGATPGLLLAEPPAQR